MNLEAWWHSLPRAGWMDDAACAGMDRHHWFAQRPTAAKQVCARCPVTNDCLAFALRTEPDSLWGRHGVFGGWGPYQRHRYAQILRRAGIVLSDLHFDQRRGVERVS